MRSPANATRPRKVQSQLFPAPIGGWIANRSKAIARGPSLPPGAAVLENFMPTATGIKLRRGSRRWATLPVSGGPVMSMFTYTVGNQSQLFVASMSSIFDVTTVSNPFPYVIGAGNDDILGTENQDMIGDDNSFGVEVVTGQTSGDWITVQFSNDAGNFLRGVNGTDTPIVYDGASFSTTPALTFVAGDQTEPQDLSFVWAYKNRMFFVKKNSLDAYYLPVNAIGGELSLLPLGAVFNLGGSLMFGSTWSLGTSGDGGLSSQCAFVTTEGEVAVFQGDNPDTIATWSLVGVYRVGRPLGKRAFITAGGDLVIATTVGFMPLSEAVQRDFAALAPAAVSNPIEDSWNQAVARRGSGEWSAVTWPDGQAVFVAPPPPAVDDQTVLAVNSNTGGWFKVTGWVVRCLAVWGGRLMYGSDDGRVMQGWIGGSDDGVAYTGRYIGLYDDMGNPASRKIARMARATILSSVAVVPTVSARFDWSSDLGAAPDAQVVRTDGVWDGATWDASFWDSSSEAHTFQDWASVGGSGIRMAPAIQVTSGNLIPLDAEVIATEMTYEIAGVVS